MKTKIMTVAALALQTTAIAAGGLLSMACYDKAPVEGGAQREDCYVILGSECAGGWYTYDYDVCTNGTYYQQCNQYQNSVGGYYDCVFDANYVSCSNGTHHTDWGTVCGLCYPLCC